jgi:hypothetical protein
MSCLDGNANCTIDPRKINPYIFPTSGNGTNGENSNPNIPIRKENEFTSLFVTSESSIVLVIVIFSVVFMFMYDRVYNLFRFTIFLGVWTRREIKKTFILKRSDKEDIPNSSARFAPDYQRSFVTESRNVSGSRRSQQKVNRYNGYPHVKLNGYEGNSHHSRNGYDASPYIIPSFYKKHSKPYSYPTYSKRDSKRIPLYHR